MQWKHYWRNVVKRYSVKIEGWPAGIDIEGFDVASCPIDDLTTMLRKWRAHTIYWKSLSPVQLEDLEKE